MPDKELKKLIQRWTEWLRTQRNYSSHTIQSYLSDLEIFLEYLAKEKVTVSDLKKLDIRAFRNFFSLRAKRGIRRTSIAREESSVRNFFKWLDDCGVMCNTAIFQISTPKLPKILPRALDVNTTFEVIDEAAQGCSEPWLGVRDMAIFTLLYGCGLRISEALSLNVEDVTQHGDFIKIRGKGNKDRYVPILPIVIERIEAYKKCPLSAASGRCSVSRGKRGKNQSSNHPKEVTENSYEIKSSRQHNASCSAAFLRHAFAGSGFGFTLNTGIAGTCVAKFDSTLYRCQFGKNSEGI